MACSNNELIPCEYSNCSITFVPSNEYNDHITLHKLQQSQQSQQYQSITNTLNDE